MKEISFSQAMSYCFHQPSFVISFVAITVAALALAVFGIIKYNKTGNAVWGLVCCGIAIVAIACALLGRPMEVKANTSQEQAARGVYIG